MSEEKNKNAVVLNGINITVRLKNKAFLVTLIAAIVALAYQVLKMFEIVPSISESEVMNIVNTILGLLVLIGVIQDPTTTGLTDSEQAKSYTEPKK